MLVPRFERLNRSWAKDLYMNILMKYPSFLMVIQVMLLHQKTLHDSFFIIKENTQLLEMQMAPHEK